MQSRGTVALPPDLRRKYALDKPGAQVEITEREDGVIEVRPLVAVPAAQAYYWSDDWQTREREVDAHLARGQFTDHADVDAFLGHLDALDAAEDTEPDAITTDRFEDGHVGSAR
jgi:bifunctional DNA-binding transcriptional regulator/antitoxin component of YhaV-PrlF toxin-antitoxin module